MSRIGRKEIKLPAGVSVEVNDLKVVVNGPKGKLEQDFDKQIKIVCQDGVITLTRSNETNDAKAKHGLYRALVNNMVIGVSEGFSKKLDIKGVGYKVLKQGNKIVLNIGLSHTIEVVEADGITLECPTATEIVVSGINKQLVGEYAAKIRALKPVEPYHGYGIKYSDEVVIKKVGKTAGKGKK